MNTNINTSTRRTSWTYKELELLGDPDNHKITSDGYDFRWYHKITGKWEIHSIKCFEDYKQPYSWLQFNLAEWGKELASRRIEKVRKVIRRQIRIERITKEREFDNARKALEIHSIKPELTNAEIGNILGVSKQMVGRYLKAVYQVN